MKILLNVLIFISLPFIFQSAGPAETASDSEQYCNNRFNYCLSYPADYFTSINGSPNGDGVLFSAPEKETKVRVAGAYNVMDWSVEDVYYFSFEELLKKDKSIELVESTMDDSWGEGLIRFKEEKKMKFFQINLLDNAYVVVMITVPDDSFDLLDRLKEEIQLTINV